MPFIGTGHIWIVGIVLLVVLIIWGPGKLPDVGSGMGRAIREFRKASHDTRQELAAVTGLDAAPVHGVPAPGSQSVPAPSASSEGQAPR